ncbi:MAG: hypothetical protein ACFFCW_36375 [Candidatus Hodarchaeota archaeon]
MTNKSSNVLGSMDKLLLEGLEAQADFVDAARFVHSLKLKNQLLETLAIDAISELVSIGLIEATSGTKIKITPRGKEILNTEGRLDWQSKSKMLKT